MSLVSSFFWNTVYIKHALLKSTHLIARLNAINDINEEMLTVSNNSKY